MEKNFGAPIMDAKSIKAKFLSGQGYNIISFIELKDPKKTSYQDSMKGKFHDDKAKIFDLERTSCGMGGVIPDP